ncbi:MAG: YciI family protein [Chthoniobacterales bacterium]
MISRLLPLVSLILTAIFAAAEPATSPSSTVPSHPDAATMEFDHFIVVLLVRPPNLADLAKEEQEKLQNGHIANIWRLHDEGKLLKAGPMEDYSGRNVRGMFILATDSQEKAREWVSSDPLVKAGRLTPEFIKWSVQKGSLK